MAEGAPLLREYRVKSSIEGSNPSHSASSKKPPCGAFLLPGIFRALACAGAVGFLMWIVRSWAWALFCECRSWVVCLVLRGLVARSWSVALLLFFWCSRKDGASLGRCRCRCRCARCRGGDPRWCLWRRGAQDEDRGASVGGRVRKMRDCSLRFPGRSVRLPGLPWCALWCALGRGVGTRPGPSWLGVVRAFSWWC